jgi:8-oxo-dGTP diphosphatase
LDGVRLTVVAAVLVDAGRVLAALRVDPPGWEFPGGKVEPGETSQHALERECREELGVQIRTGLQIATAQSDHLELQFWHVDLLDGTPQPLQDHRELRWVGRDELDDLDWLPLDREVLVAIARLLPGTG